MGSYSKTFWKLKWCFAKFLFKSEGTRLGEYPIWEQILYVKSQLKFSNCYKIAKYINYSQEYLIWAFSWQELFWYYQYYQYQICGYRSGNFLPFHWSRIIPNSTLPNSKYKQGHLWEAEIAGPVRQPPVPNNVFIF